MRYFVGIDDTDNLQTRGTGFRSRELGHLLTKEYNIVVEGITRHQLYVHEKIKYTSHNSSACLEVFADDYNTLKTVCENYLIENAAEGSDAGLCIVPADNVSDEIMAWGVRAKKEILYMDEANKIAERNNIFLRGYKGTLDGIIGSMAGVGLRAGGNDGRFIWVKGTEIREIKGEFNTEELHKITKFDEIQTIEGEVLSTCSKIFINEWIRPVLKNNKVIIFVAEEFENGKHIWKIADKEYIKSISN